MMVRIQPLLMAALFVPALAFGQTAPTTNATATFTNAKGATIGTATISPAATGVKIDVTLSQLPPGTHAIHVHTVGKCDPPDFTSAGGHFNPAGKHHGKDNPEGAHAGDLANFEADAQGNASFSQTVSGLTLGDGADSLFHPGGTALVIHATADDYKTDPAGNAGARIACGVVKKAGA